MKILKIKTLGFVAFLSLGDVLLARPLGATQATVPCSLLYDYVSVRKSTRTEDPHSYSVALSIFKRLNSPKKNPLLKKSDLDLVKESRVQVERNKDEINDAMELSKQSNELSRLWFKAWPKNPTKNVSSESFEVSFNETSFDRLEESMYKVPKKLTATKSSSGYTLKFDFMDDFESKVISLSNEEFGGALKPASLGVVGFREYQKITDEHFQKRLRSLNTLGQQLSNLESILYLDDSGYMRDTSGRYTQALEASRKYWESP